MLMPFSETYFLEVSAHVPLKVTTKVSFRGKKIQKFSIFEALLLKQKRRSATKILEMSLMNLALIYLVQLHIVWK